MRSAAPLAGLLLAVSACTGPGPTDLNRVPEPIAEEVAWANKVCALTIEVSHVVKASPELDGVPAAAARKQADGWLSLSIQIVEKTMKELEPFKTGPNTHAETVATDMISTFGSFKSALVESRRILGEAEPADTSSVTDAVTKATGIRAPTDELNRMIRASGLSEAVRRAENCDRAGTPFALTSSN